MNEIGKLLEEYEQREQKFPALFIWAECRRCGREERGVLCFPAPVDATRILFDSGRIYEILSRVLSRCPDCGSDGLLARKALFVSLADRKVYRKDQPPDVKEVVVGLLSSEDTAKLYIKEKGEPEKEEEGREVFSRFRLDLKRLNRSLEKNLRDNMMFG